MKVMFFIAFISPLVLATASEKLPQKKSENFVSTVQLSIIEEHSATLDRSKKLVLSRFQRMAQDWNTNTEDRFEIQSNGNQVTVYVMSQQDPRPRMQRSMADMVLELDHVVQVQGVANHYLANANPTARASFEVNVVDKPDGSVAGVKTIQSSFAPMRDLLREIKVKLNNQFSYIIPGECADMPVKWKFGQNTKNRPKTIDVVMSQFAEDFGLKLERRKNIFVLSDNGCSARRAAEENLPVILPVYFSPRQWEPMMGEVVQPVGFPVIQ